MELTAKTRDIFGKETAKLRKDGFIPAELYGHGTENLHLSVEAADFIKVFRSAGESTLVNLFLDGKKRPVMIHDIARDTVSNDILAIDFYQVRLDEAIKVKVSLQFMGDAPAVKEKGGVLVKALQEIEIEALPEKLPHAIEVSLLSLAEIGSSIYVKDIVPPPEVKIHAHPETVVATITEKAAEEEIAPSPDAGIEAIKVETEEKKAERVAKKETAGDAPANKAA